VVPVEPRQRWRLIFRRLASAPPLQQKELLAAWQDGLVASGLPFLPPDRPRLAFAAALPVGMPAERELVDVLLSDRLPIDELRRALPGALPEGHELIDLHDVWLGEPPLPGQTAAADYRIELGGTPDAAALTDAAARLLGSSTLRRPKPKGGGDYDLRPLLADIGVAGVFDAAGGGHPPILEENDVLGERARFGAVMGDVDERHARLGGEGGHVGDEGAAQRLVERGEGLVEQHQTR